MGRTLSSLLCAGLISGVSSFAPLRPSHVGVSVQRTSRLSAVGVGVVDETIADVVDFLDNCNQQLETSFLFQLISVLDDLTESLSTIQSTLSQVETPLEGELGELIEKFQVALVGYVEEHPQYQPVYDSVSSQMKELFNQIPQLQSIPPSMAVLLTATVTYSLLSAVFTSGQGPPPSSPYPLQRYDAASARAYFDERLPLVIKRGFEVAAISLSFGLSLLKDKLE